MGVCQEVGVLNKKKQEKRLSLPFSQNRIIDRHIAKLSVFWFSQHPSFYIGCCWIFFFEISFPQTYSSCLTRIGTSPFLGFLFINCILSEPSCLYFRWHLSRPHWYIGHFTFLHSSVP